MSFIASLIIIILLLLFVIRTIIGIYSPENIGKYGEKRVAWKLDWLSNEYVTLNDVLLPTNYGTTQIDHIVISPYGIFVIETKNYKGWILGNEKSEMWTQSLYGKKPLWGWSSVQYKLRNPIKQNTAHVIAISQLLDEVDDSAIIPIVVFSDSADLKITTYNHIVINWCSLRSTIKSFKTQLIKQEDIQKIVDKISAANIKTRDSKDKHIMSIQETLQNKKTAIANGECPRCGGYLVERQGRYGSFYGCSNYPKCRFTCKEK